MIDDYSEDQPYFVDEIKKIVGNGKLSHAYLIETRNYEKSSELVLAFAKYIYCSSHFSDRKKCDLCNLCSLIDINANSDFIQVYPDGTEIKKKQILDVKEKFMTKALVEGANRVYIIYEADKLNKFSANMLLKFLEEPEANIIGILVTENRYKVIETLRSRCQIFSFIDKKMDVIFQNFELTSSILKCLEERKKMAIAYLPQVLERQYFGKDQWTQIFTELQYIYEQSLRKFEGSAYSIEIENLLDFVLEYNDEKSLLYKLGIIHQQIQKLIYNLNINLMLDDFIICFNDN